MTTALHHRGPDGAGVWVDEDAGIVLGHRRLAVVDLSPAGHQPMHSPSDRFVISYNGEIYNFRELRVELQHLGCGFRGHSDTEVIVNAIDIWGLDDALTRFVGMFAFALWDKRDRCLHLGRDRVGEKPLYYGWIRNVLVFGSELKALWAHPLWCGDIDRDSIALQMHYGYIPAPHSIFKGIYKLPAASVLTIPSELDTFRSNFSPHLMVEGSTVRAPRLYWSARTVAQTGEKNPLESGEREIIEELDGLLRRAVRGQMIADVPVGAFLSGGVDSSTVVALMQAESMAQVRTFTIGFSERAHDEAAYAREIARYLGTDHTELYLTPQQAIEVVPYLPTLYDEPFSDASQIPTFLISKLARKHVTVCLSGDGGDELFAGYNRYLWGERLWRATGCCPRWARRLAASAIHMISTERWDKIYRRLEPVIPSTARQRLVGDKLHKLGHALAKESVMDIYNSLVSNWSEPETLVLGSKEYSASRNADSHWSQVINRMLYWDLDVYLPNDNLVKIDRASMAVSLETRLPLLDHRFVEFAWRVPLSLKIRNGQGKWALREVLTRYVPPRLFERPKTGFSVPIGEWLRGELRQWAGDLLNERRIAEDGIFESSLVQKAWRDHLNGKWNHQARLWGILMFQAWYDSLPRNSAIA